MGGKKNTNKLYPAELGPAKGKSQKNKITVGFGQWEKGSPPEVQEGKCFMNPTPSAKGNLLSEKFIAVPTDLRQGGEKQWRSNRRRKAAANFTCPLLWGPERRFLQSDAREERKEIAWYGTI